MRVFITGARQRVDPQRLERLIEQMPLVVTSVVTSDQVGVDSIARTWATRSNKELIVIPTEWERYGRHACRMRNASLIETAQACAVFSRPDCAYSLAIAGQALSWSKPIYTYYLGL